MKRSHWPSHLQIRLDRLQNSCHFGQRAILRATSVSGEWDSFVIQESTSKGLLGTSKVPLLAGRESTWKSRRKEDVVGEVFVSRGKIREEEKVRKFRNKGQPSRHPCQVICKLRELHIF